MKRVDCYYGADSDEEVSSHIIGFHTAGLSTICPPRQVDTVEKSPKSKLNLKNIKLTNGTHLGGHRGGWCLQSNNICPGADTV